MLAPAQGASPDLILACGGSGEPNATPRDQGTAALRSRVIPLPFGLDCGIARAPLLPSPGGRVSGEDPATRGLPEPPP